MAFAKSRKISDKRMIVILFSKRSARRRRHRGFVRTISFCKNAG